MTIKRMVRRLLLGGMLTAALASAIGAGLYLTWLRTPPPLPDTIEQAMTVFASPRYRRLPDTRRAAYVMHVRKLADELPQSERTDLWQRMRNEPGMQDAARQAMQDMMVAQARQFATADAVTRTAMLDAFIATMEQRQRNGNKRNPDEARQRMQRYAQYGDPQNQAYVQEFWKALRQRRHELGIK